MAAYLIVGLIIVALLAALIRVMTAPDRFSQMSEEEYEEEAKKKTLIGASLAGLETALRKRETDFVIEQKYRIEREVSHPGGAPPEDRKDFSAGNPKD